jgi:hypothetical protein
MDLFALSRFLQIVVNKDDKAFDPDDGDVRYLVGAGVLDSKGDATPLGKAFLIVLEQTSVPEVVYINSATKRPVFEYDLKKLGMEGAAQ